MAGARNTFGSMHQFTQINLRVPSVGETGHGTKEDMVRKKDATR